MIVLSKFVLQLSWSERARLSEEKRSRSEMAKNSITIAASERKTLTNSSKCLGALRLSLDQQRRNIEANRQRALRQGDKATLQRNQAAFLALLHSSQVCSHSFLLPGNLPNETWLNRIGYVGEISLVQSKTVINYCDVFFYLIEL